jgi:hypothetical protein
MTELEPWRGRWRSLNVQLVDPWDWLGQVHLELVHGYFGANWNPF